MKKGIIIGAGIGGLTTAIALARKGIDVTVYEQSDAIREVGAGIWMAPNGLKVFRELGIAEGVLSAGKSLEKISIVDPSNRPVSVIDGESVRARHGFSTVAIHRAVLLNILAGHFPTEKVVLHKRFQSYRQTDQSITAIFEDGDTAEADFLLAADGIRSNARKQLLPAHELRYSGQTCWRFVTEFDFPENEEHHMYEVWANAKGLRAGYSRINEKQAYVYLTHFEKAGGKDHPATVKSDLLNLFAGFQPVVRDLIDSCRAEDILRNDLFDFKPISRWTDGRMALLGDAAHSTTPNLGQGACQAIEDALAIAGLLSEASDIPQALRRYQEKRIRKATFITNTSWRFAQMTNTTGPVKSLIKTLLRMTPEKVNERQFDRIYSL